MTDGLDTSNAVSIRLLTGVSEMASAEQLLQRVWGSETVQLDTATLRALAHTGNYVAGAFCGNDLGDSDGHAAAADQGTGGELIGCAVGFFAPPAERSLHSHIAGVDPRFTGRGIGTLIKNHQRAWCLEQGVTAMTWTFDPAIARNAHVNLTKLGVTVVAYLEDFYGPLLDGLNAGSPSDRLMVRWDLISPATSVALVDETTAAALVTGPLNEPVVQAVHPLAATVRVAVPRDIEGLRRTDPSRAEQWRGALREVLGGLLGSGSWRITGFLRPGGYLLQRTS